MILTMQTYLYIYLEPKWPLFWQTSLMTFTFLDSTLGKVKLIRACKERCFYSKGLEQIPDFIRESNKRYLCNLRQTYPMSGKRNIIFKHALGEDMLDCQEGILWSTMVYTSPNSLWPGKLVAPKGSGLHVEKKSMAVQNLGNIFGWWNSHQTTDPSEMTTPLCGNDFLETFMDQSLVFSCYHFFGNHQFGTWNTKIGGFSKNHHLFSCYFFVFKFPLRKSTTRVLIGKLSFLPMDSILAVVLFVG